MEQKKIKILNYLAFSGILLFISLFGTVFALDSVALSFSTHSATGLGSSNSVISVNSNLQYVNKGNNTSIIHNYFEGFYHDSVLGYFKVNWSSSQLENIRVISSTNKCGSGYGYKLGGYAYSEAFGYVDFDYDSNIFVYYCENDKELHGYTYNVDLGFQNFDGVSFEIEVNPTVDIVEPTGTGAFVNDETTVTSSGGTSTEHTIQTDIIEFDVTQESLFYIIK